MIQVYKSHQSELQTVDEIVPGCWINVHDPSPREIAELHQATGVPEDFLTSALDADELPRTERDEAFTLIILRLPYYRGKDDPVPYNTIPLSIILNETTVITVCAAETEIIHELTVGSWRRFSTAKRKRFVLRLFLKTATRYLQYLRVINRAVEATEVRLETSQRNQEVIELLKFQKSLTYFMTALRANEVVMARLQRSRMFEEFPEDSELLEDVLTEMRQAIEMTAIATGILENMMDAFASIISNNLNVVMKFLAAITVILTFPTMIASFYGMNVALPLQDSPYGFVITVGISVVLVLIALFIFVRKRYL